MKMELRSQSVQLKSNGDLVVEGYVNQTGALSNILGTAKRFREKIAPGAFRRAIESRNREIDFLAEHNKDKVLASTRNGSLKLREDEKGLWMSATITPTSYGKDYYELISSRLISNMSFGFRSIKDSWQLVEGMAIRTVEQLELFEVSAVREPAYSQSIISARGIDLIEEVEVPEEISEHSENKTGERGNNMENFEILETRENGFVSYLQNGEKRSLQTTAEGAAVIPENVADMIIRKMQETSSVFAQARKFPMSNGSLKVPYETSNGVATFVGEGANLQETDLGLNFVQLKQKRVGAATRLTQQLVNEMSIDSESYVADRIGRALAKEVEKAILVTGGDVAAPDNFTGSIKRATGVTDIDLGDASDTSVSIEKLLDLYNAVHPDFLEGSEWIMSRTFFNMVSKKKDANGHFYMQNGVVNGRLTYTLFGAPVRVSDVMDAGDAINQFPVFFGNIQEAYALAIHKEQSLQRISGDTTQALAGTVLLLGDIYLDGAVVNPQAIVRGERTA